MKASHNSNRRALVGKAGKLGGATSPTVEYNIRYASNWRQISLECRQSTNNKCCFLGCSKEAIESHHALYFDKEGAIAGRELIAVHVFPLCELHHGKESKDGAHNWRNWIKGHKDPVLGNRNTASYYKKLRQGWLEKCI